MAAFVIWSPPYSHKSGGIRALYQLAQMLKDRGQQVRIVTDFIEADQNETAIYPEIVSGNPLNAGRIVRWCMRPNRQPWPGDLVYVWDENFNIKHDGILYVPILDRSVFNRIGEGERCLILTYKAPRVAGDVEITDQWPETWPELADLFRRGLVLRCGDPLTATAAEARLCGCLVDMLNGRVGKIDLNSPTFEQELMEYESHSAGLVDALIERCEV